MWITIFKNLISRFLLLKYLKSVVINCIYGLEYWHNLKNYCEINMFKVLLLLETGVNITKRLHRSLGVSLIIILIAIIMIMLTLFNNKFYKTVLLSCFFIMLKYTRSTAVCLAWYWTEIHSRIADAKKFFFYLGNNHNSKFIFFELYQYCNPLSIYILLFILFPVRVLLSNEIFL